MKFTKKYYWLYITIFVFTLDRVTKLLVLQNLYYEQPVNISPFLNLFFTFNTGAAFGFLNRASGWQEWLFIIITCAVSTYLIMWQIKMTTRHVWLKTALACILGGAIGNLYDRIIYHHVIDFIDFYFRQWHFATFNLADTAICIGAIMLILDILHQEKKEKAARH